MAAALRRVLRALTRLLMVFLCVLALGGGAGGCSCSPDALPTPPRALLACRTHTPRRPSTSRGAPAIETVRAGTLPGTFSISSTGEATYVMPLASVPGRAGVEPALSLTYDSAAVASDGILGSGFSLGGLSAITPCPSNLATDGEIRGVRYDADDKLCLDGRRLVPVAKEAGIIEYRTLPDTFVQVLGHFPPEGKTPESALFFEARLPSGLIIEYGNNGDGKPLARGGVPRAWLSTKAHDGRGNAMTYSYCFAEDAGGYTAEYALDEIRYTSFEGTPTLEPSRAVQFVYGTKDPAAVRAPYSGGMALQSSLRLDEIQMLGPENSLVRRYILTYGLGPTTNRTLLTQVEECAGDWGCKPSTRFQFKSSPAGFKQIATSLPTPTSTRASPMLVDTDGDGRDDLLIPDTDKALSTPENPITQWVIAQNHGPSASPPYFSSTALAFSEDWLRGADPSGPADPALIQPEVGTGIDYDQNGRMDVLVHDVYGSRAQGLVLLAQPDHTFKSHDTGIARPFPLGSSPKPPTLTSAGGSVHLADLDGDGVPDLIECQDHSQRASGDPAKAAWTVHLWKLAQDGAPTGFDPTGATLEPLAGVRCDTELYTLDVNGDSKVDLLVQRNVFENLAPDQDLLVTVIDGMNALDPTDQGFTPNVSVAYGHLTDDATASGVDANDPARESMLYLSHADAANDCAYPRTCAVGSRRVVSGYATNNGADGQRRFAVRYRDGRYHRLGRGFLGFAERIITDLDTGAGTADFYDNTTFIAGLNVFPFAGQVAHEWRWQPGLPSQPKPEQIELSFTDVTRTFVPTNGGATYFTLFTERRVRQEQGTYSSQGSAAPTALSYVQQVASSGGATVLRDTVTKVSDFDTFGNVRVEDILTSGVDLTLHVERTFKNDTDRWLLGRLQTQKECSSASMLSACRTLTRTTTIYGEVDTDSLASDDGSLDTQLTVSYPRDVFGNVAGVIADDAYGHHRSSSTTYDPEGIFPQSYVNAAGHTTLTEYDGGLGVLTRRTDPNHLVTRWAYDGFGRLGRETRPDGTETTVRLSRDTGGGPHGTGWSVTQWSTTTGGADSAVQYDSLGRPVRWWWYGPDLTGGLTRQMQEITYDALGEHVARRSVPVSEDTPQSKLLFDAYEYDAVGREVKHVTPWNAVVQTSYDGLLVQVIDPRKGLTVVAQDPLGRPVTITDAAKGTIAYTYGPFGTLYTVTDPGGALTRMTRDAYGRVQKLEDPDRGSTISAHDGFGELISSLDAGGRGITFGYDALGRPSSRLDQHGAESLTTTWTWDTAVNGIGKLQALTSPDGEKTYTYNGLGELETLTLAVNGQSDLLKASLDYDEVGRVKTITYPAPGGAAPFAVTQDYDLHGHVLAVRDSATNLPYWRLTEVDSAGRFRKEVFGNDVSTERDYYADKQSLAGIVTQRGATVVQRLSYDYDAQLNLARRTDMLQPQNGTERFRYDALERLTCAYFSATEDPAAPCALGYGYDPNGNLTGKSDVGALSYGDPLHPHAVTSAGSDSFGYDAVGNQNARPGGATLTYTPFDLPKTIKQGASAITFAYNGDAQRIRKTTPKEETLYFEDFYERVTAMGVATEHRYYVHSPERVVAVVTRGGTQPGTRYLHVDHLGSVDALTDEGGAVVERRSYDPFGQRRNPVWGQPPPALFSSLTTQGFTGHESDDELGLVNMKGRVYDPKVGRFLTTDPIVSKPLSGQGWNPYAYVLGRPLTYVDPSGFAASNGLVSQPGYPDVPLPVDVVTPDPVFPMARHMMQGGPPPGAPAALQLSKPEEGAPQAAEVGAAVPPVDVSTTGNASGYVPQPVTTASNADGTGGAPSWPWYEGVFRFNDHTKAWIAEDELDRRRSGVGGAPPVLMGGSHPIAGSLPVVGLAVSVASDTSAVPADVGAAAVSISGLSGLLSLRLPVAAERTETAAVNGNSLLSQNAQHVYEILRTDAAGNTDVFKYGISGGPLSAAGLSVRAETQVSALTRAAGGTFTYDSSIVATILGGPGARGAALSIEKDLVYQYLELVGRKPFGNLRP